jgi:hypothetical protein
VALIEPRGVWLLPKAPVTDTPLLTSDTVEETRVYGVAFENLRTPPHREPSANIFDKSLIAGSETITLTEQDAIGAIINGDIPSLLHNLPLLHLLIAFPLQCTTFSLTHLTPASSPA